MGNLRREGVKTRLNTGSRRRRHKTSVDFPRRFGGLEWERKGPRKLSDGRRVTLASPRGPEQGSRGNRSEQGSDGGGPGGPCKEIMKNKTSAEKIKSLRKIPWRGGEGSDIFAKLAGGIEGGDSLLKRKEGHPAEGTHRGICVKLNNSERRGVVWV